MDNILLLKRIDEALDSYGCFNSIDLIENELSELMLNIAKLYALDRKASFNAV